MDDLVARVIPEPPADEREALLAALEEARAGERSGLDPWAATALSEATDNELEPPG